MCYMLSKQQYLSDTGINWHPHLMFFVAGNAGKAGGQICRARQLWRRTTLKNGQLFSWSGSSNGPMGQRIRRLCSDLGFSRRWPGAIGGTSLEWIRQPCRDGSVQRQLEMGAGCGSALGSQRFHGVEERGTVLAGASWVLVQFFAQWSKIN